VRTLPKLQVFRPISRLRIGILHLRLSNGPLLFHLVLEGKFCVLFY
jgi:hypothetical protein